MIHFANTRRISPFPAIGKKLLRKIDSTAKIEDLRANFKIELSHKNQDPTKFSLFAIY